MNSSKAAVGTAVVCAATACAVAALIVRRRATNKNRLKRAIAILRDFEDKCSTPLQKLKLVVDSMIVEMNTGLANEDGSKVKMLISYVDNLPTGYQVPLDPEPFRPDGTSEPFTEEDKK